MTRLLLGLLSLAISVSPAVGAELRAAAGRLDITPPLGFPLWGYSVRHDQGSEGVHDPLEARILVLEVDKTRVALVGLDLGRAPTRQSMAAIRALVKKSAGVEHLFLVGSHTHNGPVIELDNWPTPKTSYARELERKLAGGIVAAAKDLAPARLGIAARQVPLNRNRHSRRADAPVDRELLVVRVETPDGKPLAHVVNFAAHPTMINSKDRKFSADYPGVMRRLVEKQTEAPCLFLQGAGGDLSPNPPDRESANPAGFGAALGKQVLELDKTIRCAVGKDTMLKCRERDFRFKSQIDMDNPLIHTAYSLAFFPGLIDFYAREYREGIRPHLTTAILDGKIGIVGVSGEFFCAHSLRLKQRARLEHLLFLGYCNDYQQYFPTIEAIAEGGYGADAKMSPVEVGAGEQVMDRALRDLYEMRGKIESR